MTPVYIPLIPGTKRPAVKGWTSPDFESAGPGECRGRRCDGLVVIDCDTESAAASWIERSGAGDTFTVKTPRGTHFYYRHTPGSPTGPAVGVLDHVDVRAGSGSFVVVPPTEGYVIISPESARVREFDASWIPATSAGVQTRDEVTWSTVPEGKRNATLASIAGTLRRQGMDPQEILKTISALNNVYCSPPLDSSEVIAITQSITRYEAPGDVTVEWADKEHSALPVFWAGGMRMPPPPEWYWKPYLPKGRLVFMDGREGIGKGMFCVYLALMATQGRSPDGTGTVPPCNVLWLPTEDDPEEDIIRRLYSAGYDPEAKGCGDIGFITQRIKVPVDADLLADAIREHDASLVIMDPGRSYLGPEVGQVLRDFSFNNEAHIRPGLESLIGVARATKATILFVHHWNKATGSDVFYRQGGSAGFNQAIRHRVTIARVEHGDEIEGAFAVVKSNIVSPGHVRGFTLETDTELDTARFVLQEEMPEWGSLDAWLKATEANRDEGGSPNDRIYTWLALTLRPGDQVPSREVIMKQFNFSQHQVRRALKVLRDDGSLQDGARGTIWAVA